MHEGLSGISAIPFNSLRRPVRNSRHSDSDTFTILSSRLGIVISTRSSLEPFQNGMSYRRMFNPNHPLSLFVLPSFNFLDQLKIIYELWHFGIGSNGRNILCRLSLAALASPAMGHVPPRRPAV